MPHEIPNRSNRDSLKIDNYVTTTGGLHWTSATRKSVIVTCSLMLAIIIVVVAAGVFVTARESSASAAFGSAMEIYQSPIDVPGQPPTPGVKSYATLADRAKAANTAFAQVAGKYGMTQDGKNARYFEGLTQLEQGQTGSAETTLKEVANGWNKELASLAKFSLADLYRQTGRDSQAVDLYNQLSDKPTDAVPYGMAQIQLAELYTTQGKADLAHKIYAQLKDKDPKSAAGLVAAKKLNPAASPEPQM